MPWILGNVSVAERADRRDRIVASITNKVVGSTPVHGEVYSVQHYVIKFVSDLRQVGGFLRFPSSIKLTATI